MLNSNFFRWLIGKQYFFIMATLVSLPFFIQWIQGRLLFHFDMALKLFKDWKIIRLSRKHLGSSFFFVLKKR